MWSLVILLLAKPRGITGFSPPTQTSKEAYTYRNRKQQCTVKLENSECKERRAQIRETEVKLQGP